MRSVTETMQLLKNQNQSGGFIYEARHRNYQETLGRTYISIIDDSGFESLNEKDMKLILSYIWQVPRLLHGWRKMCLEHGADEAKYDNTLEKIDRIVAEYSRLFYALK